MKSETFGQTMARGGARILGLTECVVCGFVGYLGDHKCDPVVEAEIERRNNKPPKVRRSYGARLEEGFSLMNQ